MAGLRVGYVCAKPTLIEKLKKYQVGFGIDISAISLAAASGALDDSSFVQNCVEVHEVEKQRIYNFFDSKSIKYVPSSTSFIYFSTSSFKPDLVKYLESQNILIREYKDQIGHARVSLGTPQQVDAFIERCQEHLLI